MPSHPISYLLPDDFDLQELKSSFKESYGLREEVPSKAKLTYYDSFDWRVWSAGGELHQEQGSHKRLCWHSIKGRREPLSQIIDQPPGFAKDLPAGALADLLSS
ncbi:MAG: hypothetical protein JAY91_10295, partial [Candidatus Thiodiazotropha endolucinida]|nr:hypothetical protein [Candidatus Thiodiazotropha taylori]MCW4241270.1 hypothetical protein [Candidatus Thiodiazotropha taylori]